MTMEHVRWYSETVHPINTIPAIVADMWIGADEPEKHGYQPTDVLTFPLMATIKGRFPSRKAQFCTEKLKLMPVKRWILATFPGGDYEYYSGVRRDESDNRKHATLRDFSELFDCYANRPIVDWSKDMCFSFVKGHGEQINPLYALGFKRVGCAPCINSGKDDILNWVKRFPEMIEKVRRWEGQVGRTFFPPMVPGKPICFIDDVIAWAYTSHGGKQVNMLRMYEEPEACASAFGLCE